VWVYLVLKGDVGKARGGFVQHQLEQVLNKCCHIGQDWARLEQGYLVYVEGRGKDYVDVVLGHLVFLGKGNDVHQMFNDPTQRHVVRLGNGAEQLLQVRKVFAVMCNCRQPHQDEKASSSTTSMYAWNSHACSSYLV
jgi:hypothetical protein